MARTHTRASRADAEAARTHAKEAPPEPRLLDHLRTRRIPTLAMLQSAGLDGLVLFDEDEDALAASNRLLLNYSGLHEFLSDICDQWAENECDSDAHFSALLRGAGACPDGAGDDGGRRRDG